MTLPSTDRLPAWLLARDAAAPRVTWYDDEPGPTSGERIELSARVLTNWANKAANLLQDELDAGPGTRVGLALPTHWRAVYWALGAWQVGACVVVAPAGGTLDAADGDVLVTDDPAAAARADEAVLVTLAALARGHAEAAQAPGALDEARVLATFGDVFVANDEPDAAGPVLLAGDLAWSSAQLCRPVPGWGERPRVMLRGALRDTLPAVVAALTADGSVVLSRGEADDADRRAEVENVTVRPPLPHP